MLRPEDGELLSRVRELVESLTFLRPAKRQELAQALDRARAHVPVSAPRGTHGA